MRDKVIRAFLVMFTIALCLCYTNTRANIADIETGMPVEAQQQLQASFIH